jgi:23S rRNA pseudouridine1911/1915/1917 synthase
MKLQVKEPMSLIEALSTLSPQSSKTTFKAWLKEGRVTVDGNRVQLLDMKLSSGQTIELGARAKFMQGGIRILYDDKALVIIDKPSGVLSVSTVFQKEETAHAYLKVKYRPRKIYVVHRLDQDTSGVMVFAFTEESNKALKETFKAHDIDRIYYAVVEGRMEETAGTWQAYLYEDANYVMHTTQDQQKGVLAITHYKVKARTRQYSLLELKLETGKKNQIRVHCQQAKHPIAGDKKYGAMTDPFKRLGLHAYLLAFKHPLTGRKISMTSPLPEVFEKVFPKGVLHENA